MERTDKQFRATFIGVAMLIIGGLFAVHCLIGCTTERRAVKWFNKHEPKRAEMCHLFYPCQDSVHTEYRYLEGETQYIKGDTAFTESVTHDTVTQTITKRILRVDTVYKDKVVYQTDKAEIAAQTHVIDSLKSAIASKTSDNVRLKKWANRFIYENLIIALLVVIFGVYIGYRWKAGAVEELAAKIGRNG